MKNSKGKMQSEKPAPVRVGSFPSISDFPLCISTFAFFPEGYGV